MAKLLEQISQQPYFIKQKQLKQYQQAVNDFDKTQEPLNNVTAYAKGRMFDDSFNLSPRSNGHSDGRLIDLSPYIIESLFRHEALSEIDLIADEVETDGTYNYLYFNGVEGYLSSLVDDYYNGAYLLNLTRDYVAPILDYWGIIDTVEVKKIKIDDAYTVATTDKYKIFNIQSSIIDTASFDVIGNTTNGLRKDWKFAKSVNKIESLGDIITPLLYESQASIFKSFDKYKLFANLDDVTSVGTFLNPAYELGTGLPLMGVSLTPIENIYTDFTFNYGYEYGREEYQSKLQISNNFATTLTTGNFDAEQVLIKDAISKYRVNKKFERSCDWIYDEATAVLFAKKIINLFTKQRYIITFIGEISSYIKYEIGDVVLMDYADIIPAALNNSAKFQIIYKAWSMQHKDGMVTFNLIEV